MDANTGEIITELAEGNQSPNFEELNILTPGLTWSPDGSKIALAALSHGYDVIYVFDVEERNTSHFQLKWMEFRMLTGPGMECPLCL